MDSEGYYTYYYCSAFTRQERNQLKELFGRDLFGKGYTGKDLTEEQVQRILTRISPLLRQWLKTKDILPFLRQRYLLTETETLHLKSGSLRPQEQAVRLVEFLMNKGSFGIGALYLCLIESSEQLSGLPAHYQLAGELKQIVQAECGVSSMAASSAAGGDDNEPLQSLHLVVENLHGITVTPETGRAFVGNLGFSEEEFPSIPGDLLSICHLWMDRRSVCYVEELTEALVRTRGLGRFTTRLCDPRNATSLELRNFFLSLGDKWQDIAEYLGFSAEEIQGIFIPYPDNTEMQVTEFLRLWQLPDCGQRILPLMHQLKSLTGIVEPKNPSRRFDDRPGTLGYMNRHLKTDITGNPHRSLDTYAHSTPPRPPASGHSFPGSSSFRQPAHSKLPGYQPAHPKPPGYHRSSSHPLSTDSGHPHQRRTVAVLFLQGNPDSYESYDGHSTNSFDFRDQGPTIEELPDDSTSSTPHGSPLKSHTSSALPRFTATESGHSDVAPETPSRQPHPPVQKQSLHGNEVEPRRVVLPSVVEQGFHGNEVFPKRGQDTQPQGQLFGNEVFQNGGRDAQPQGQLFGNEVFPNEGRDAQPQGQLFGNEVFQNGGRDAQPQGQLFGNEVFPNEGRDAQPQEQLFGNEVFQNGGRDGHPQGQLLGNVFPNGDHSPKPPPQLFGNQVSADSNHSARPEAQLFGNEVFPSGSSKDTPPRDTPAHGQLFGNEVSSGDHGSWRPHLLGNEVDRNSEVGRAVVSQRTSGISELETANNELSQPGDDDAQHNNDLSAPTPEMSNARPFPPPSFHPPSSSQPAFTNAVTDSQPQSLSSLPNDMSSDADSVHTESETQTRNSSSSQPHVQQLLAANQPIQETAGVESRPSSTGAVTTSSVPADDFSSLESREYGDMFERDYVSNDNERRDQEGVSDLTEEEQLALALQRSLRQGDMEAELQPTDTDTTPAAAQSTEDDVSSLESREHGDMVERDSVSKDNERRDQETCGHDVISAIEDPDGLEMLTALVESGAKINLPTEDGTYPIHYAVASGSSDKMLLMLNSNVNVNATRADGKTALHVACIKQDFQMIQILVERGADVSAQDQQGFTCLHFKESLESIDIVAYLVHKGTPFDTPSKDSYLTPLLVCCFTGEETFEAACHLITRGASANGSPKSHMKPLITASEEGHVRMVELLLVNGADANLTDQDGNTPLLKACLSNHPEVAEKLLQGTPDVNVNATNSEGLTPLMVAVTNSSLELVGILIAHDADVNCSRISKFNLAGSEMPMEMTPLADASARGRLEIVQALVENKAEVNSISERAFPPIAFAVLGGHTNIVEYLLKQNDLDASLNGLSQPFVLAVKSQNRECADLLIARYRGIDRLLEDAAQNSMHEVVEHVQMYKRMDPNARGSPVEQQANPTPPPLQQVTPPEAIAQQQLPPQQLPQQQFPQQQLQQQQPFPQQQSPRQQLTQQQQQPTPAAVTHSPQDEPLNDFSDETLNQFDSEPLQQFGRQGQAQTQPQNVLNNFEEMTPYGNERTSVRIPVPWQQTPAESQSPWQQTPTESQRSSHSPASQGTPQQVDFVQKPQPPHTDNTSLQSNVQRGPPMSLRQAADVAQTQMANGATTGGTETDSQEVDKSLFEPRPRSPPPVASPEPQPHPAPLPVALQTPDLSQHSMVEVLHEFAQICISAAVRQRGHEWLIDRVASSGYSHLLEFFVQYFDNSAEFARDGKLVAEFIGGAPSPLNFLLSGHVTRADFENVLKDIGRPEFAEQLMMALHQFPGSEHLPWTASGMMDALFNQHFSIGSAFPSPSSLRPTSPPPPQPVHRRQQSKLSFPETGGHRLGRGHDEKPNEPTPHPVTSREEHSPSGSQFSGQVPMSNVIVQDTPVPVPRPVDLSSLVGSTGDELNDLSVLDDQEPELTQTSSSTALSLPSIQLQSSLMTMSPGVPQASREGINSPLTTKPQPSDINTVKTTAVAKPSVSPTVVTSGSRVSTRAVALNGRADPANPSHSMPTSLSQEWTTTSAHHLPPSSITPRQPPSTQPSSTQLHSLGDGGQPLSSPAGGRTTLPHSLPRSSHLAATKAAARETPPRVAQKLPPSTTPHGSHALPVLAKTPPSKSSSKAPFSQRHGKEPVAKPPPSVQTGVNPTAARHVTPGDSTVQPKTSPKPMRQSRIPVAVKSGSPLPSRSTSTENLMLAKTGGSGSKKLPQSSVPHARIEKKHASLGKQAAGSEKREAPVVVKPLPNTGSRGRAVGFEKVSKTPTLPRHTATTAPKWHPKKKTSASSREKLVSLTSTQPPSQESSQYYNVSTDVHEMHKTIDTLEGLTFTHEQVPDPEKSELFKVVAPRISKWKVLGRYLGLDDDTLDAIYKENHFSAERCYKMLVAWRMNFRAKATYLELAKGLKNIMREDLLPALLPYMIQTSEDGNFNEGERIIIPIGENPDLRTVKDKFRLHKNSGMNSARITLQYPSRVSSQCETLHFILPSLDESSVKVLEVLCVAANIREEAKNVQLFVQYLD